MTPDKPKAAPIDHLRFHRSHAHLAPTFGNDTFALKAEAFARFFGTPTFLGAQTVIVILWVALNVSGITHFDVYPFILLNLAFSLQSAYAAPLILLAQNRQEARDRLTMEEDRRVAAQSRADMDFLAREIASIRMGMGEMATRDFMRSELRSSLRELLVELEREDEDSTDGESGSSRRRDTWLRDNRKERDGRKDKENRKNKSARKDKPTDPKQR